MSQSETYNKYMLSETVFERETQQRLFSNNKQRLLAKDLFYVSLKKQMKFSIVSYKLLNS